MTNAVSIAQLGANNSSFTNRIINGGMVIDQRNAGASVTPTTNGGYSVDRWQMGLSVASKFSIQQSSTAPTGFAKSILITSLSAYSPTSTDLIGILQPIEGLNMTDVGFGAAGASTLTLSFWVRSSLTGTFGGVLTNYANDRSYPFSYTINSANTFEQKTITITGDTTGTWATTNTGWGQLWFALGVGSTKATTAGSWVAGAYYSVTGATNLVGTNGATFYITGVQLEKGSTATSFDYRPYGTELALCQRYYEKNWNQNTASATGIGGTGALICVAMTTAQLAAMWTFKQTKRTTPTLTLYSFNGTAGSWSNVTANTDFAVSQPWGVGDNGFARLDSTGLTAGAGYWGFAVASAEL